MKRKPSIYDTWIGAASGPIVGGPKVNIYPLALKSECGLALSLTADGLLTDGLCRVYPAGDRETSRELARQVVFVREQHVKARGR